MTDINYQSGGQLGDHSGGESIPMGGITRTGERSKSEIGHTEATETITGIYNQHNIVKGTFPWSTTDPVGKVICMFANHPNECNFLTAYIYALFTAWIGTIEFNFRILGTAFMGGSLAFILVPPTYTREQALALTREEASIFPYTELDPKLTEGFSFKLTDFRKQHFHTGPFIETDPESFGGWIICQVWGALNVSPNTEGAILNMIVTCKGAYDFQRIHPPFNGLHATQGPLSYSIQPIGYQSGCDDRGSLPGTTRINLSTLTTITNGAWFAGRPSSAEPWLIPSDIVGILSPGNAWNGVTVGDWRIFRDFMLAQRELLRTTGECRVNWVSNPANKQEVNPSTKIRYALTDTLEELSLAACIPLNARVLPTTPALVYYSTAGNLNFQHPLGSLALNIFTDPVIGKCLEITCTGNIDNGVTCLTFPENMQNDMSQELMWNVHTPINEPLLAGEKIVGFTGFGGGSWSAQTTEMARDLQDYPHWPARQSAIYAVYNPQDSDVLMYMRVSSSGVCSTRYTGSSMTINNAHLSLKFVQWLPDNASMPANPPSLTQYTIGAEANYRVELEREMKKLRREMQRLQRS
jgi:hypothetical protein